MTAKWAPADPQNVIDAYVGGTSAKRLAAQHGVSCRAVHNLLTRYGISQRGRSEAELLKWSQMTEDQIKRQVRDANEAMRGRAPSFEKLCKAAKTRELNAPVSSISEAERIVFAALTSAGYAPTAQKAIGPYNCDIAVDGVAVEIFGGQWHFGGRHAARAPKRFKHIADAGWHVYVIVVLARRQPLTNAAVDDLVAFLQQTRSNPSARREYRVVGGAGKFLAAGHLDVDYTALMKTLCGGKHIGA